MTLQIAETVKEATNPNDIVYKVIREVTEKAKKLPWETIALKPWGFMYKGIRVEKSGDKYTWRKHTGTPIEIIEAIKNAYSSLKKSIK